MVTAALPTAPWDVFGDMIGAATDLLTDALKTADEAADWEAVAHILHAARAARSTKGPVGFVEADAQTALARLMPQRVTVMAGFGSLERKGGNVRTDWDHPAIASRLVARIADERVDLETGEVMPPAVFAERIAAELLACGHVDYWRTGALKDRGIDPERYCTKEKGAATVIIRPVEVAS